jgi:hypothetical protein
MTTFKQKSKVGVSGSFINQMMANNSSIPEVGKGATELRYSDRECYEVVWVSDDKMTARLQRLDASFNHENGESGEIGHQNWKLTPIDSFMTVVWKHGNWKVEGTEVIFTKEFIDEMEAKGVNYYGMWLRKHSPELADKIWGTDTHPQNVVEGITRRRKCYTKIKLIFGVKDYYYDWSF